jgi:hypothetical protein
MANIQSIGSRLDWVVDTPQPTDDEEPLPNRNILS